MEPKQIKCPFTGAETLLCQAIGEEVTNGIKGSVTIVFHLLENKVVIGIFKEGERVNARTNKEFQKGDIVVAHRNILDLYHNSYYRSYKNVDRYNPKPLEEIPYQRVEFAEGFFREKVFVYQPIELTEYSKL